MILGNHLPQNNQGWLKTVDKCTIIVKYIVNSPVFLETKPLSNTQAWLLHCHAKLQEAVSNRRGKRKGLRGYKNFSLNLKHAYLNLKNLRFNRILRFRQYIYIGILWVVILLIFKIAVNIYLTSGGRNGNLLQYPCLENPMDREAWQVTVQGVQRLGHNWSNLARDT